MTKNISSSMKVLTLNISINIGIDIGRYFLYNNQLSNYQQNSISVHFQIFCYSSSSHFLAGLFSYSVPVSLLVHSSIPKIMKSLLILHERGTLASSLAQSVTSAPCACVKRSLNDDVNEAQSQQPLYIHTLKHQHERYCWFILWTSQGCVYLFTVFCMYIEYDNPKMNGMTHNNTLLPNWLIHYSQGTCTDENGWVGASSKTLLLKKLIGASLSKHHTCQTASPVIYLSIVRHSVNKCPTF